MNRPRRHAAFAALALGLAACPAPAADLPVEQAPAQTPTPAWPADFYDPGATDHGAADLLLPMPCGGAMAFQRIEIPMPADDPMADVRLRLGNPDEAMAFAEYLRPAWLRGGFVAADGQSTHFYMARYELDAAQLAALSGDCTGPGRRDRVAAGGISWFRANDLARIYTEWLYAQARDSLPTQDGALPFLRLPTETEWEYAARGGARIDAGQFSARRFFADAPLNDYAVHFAPGSSSGKLAAVGTRLPNPVGLFDIYGNAEELMLEPFRLNVLGREHGQAGGLVSRGGSALSAEAQVYSAQRSEFPPFDPATGQPLVAQTFGLRLVLALPVTTSDHGVTALRDRWQVLAAGTGNVAGNGAAGGAAPLGSLDDLIAGETDPRRVAALENLKADLRQAQERGATALRQSARSTLIAGAIFVGNLREGDRAVADKKFNLGILEEQGKVTADPRAREQADRLILSQRRQLAALGRNQTSSLLSYGAALQTLTTDIPEEETRAAFGQLRSEFVLSGDQALLDLLDAFWRDLAVFRTRPDGDPAMLRELALK